METKENIETKYIDVEKTEHQIFKEAIKKQGKKKISFADSISRAASKDLKFKDKTKFSKEPFMKFDQDKIMVSLVDPDFILGVGDILTFGAKKYAKNNWQKNTDIDRYKDSTMRHMLAYLSGELYDDDSGKPHLDHIATNVMFLRYFEHGKGSL
jgi:hypothetical protein